MKYIYITLCLIFSTSAFASDFWGEVRFSDQDGVMSEQVSGGVDGENWFAFGQLADGYTQLYVGPKIMVSDTIEFGAGLGAETIGQGWEMRFGSYLLLAHDSFSLLATYENGHETGEMYSGLLRYQVTPVVAVGLETHRIFGSGVRAEFNISEHISVRGSVLQKDQADTYQLAIKYRF